MQREIANGNFNASPHCPFRELSRWVTTVKEALHYMNVVAVLHAVLMFEWAPVSHILHKSLNWVRLRNFSVTSPMQLRCDLKERLGNIKILSLLRYEIICIFSDIVHSCIVTWSKSCFFPDFKGCIILNWCNFLNSFRKFYLS